MAAPAARHDFEVVVPPEIRQAMFGGGTIAPRVSREMALQVPAVLRARNLICGSLSTLPLSVWGPDKRQVPTIAVGSDQRAVTYLAPNPDPELPQSVVLAETYEDLLFEGVSWWRVTRRGWHGFPVEAQHVPHSSVFVAQGSSLLPSQQRVTPDQSIPRDGTVYVDGRPVRDDEIIRFDSPNPPLLVAAARAIRTCLQLEITASLYIKDPLPLGYFAPADGAEEMDDDDVQDLLDDWEAQRAKRATGYVPKSLEFKGLQWDAKQLQLVEQRAAARLEIALAAGLEPEDLGVSTTSRTYANREQRNQDRINFTFGALASAVQERLSMRDVVPRGYETRVTFAGFTRGDALTRMQTYKAGLEVGAYADEDEVRAEEGKPPLTPEQKAARGRKAPTPTPPPVEPAQQTREGRGMRQLADFTAPAQLDGTVHVQFEGDTDFKVDMDRRTITGLLLPWGAIGKNGYAKWRFAENSVDWSEQNVNRIKLNFHHDRTEMFAYATRVQSGRAGLTGTFKVDSSPEGDRALQKANDKIFDAFSVEIEFMDMDSWQTDPTDETVRLVRQATLRGAALTGSPAFDDARVTGVKATREQGEPDMTAPNKAVTGQQGQPPAFDFEAFTADLADTMKQQQQAMTAAMTEFAQSVGESLSAGIKVALDGISAPQDGPQPVRAARYTVTREAPVYALNGGGHSLVRDAWFAVQHRDDTALDRLRKFRNQTEDLAKLTHSEIQRQRFTTITTGNASQVIPPGYRPDLFVPMLTQGRPLTNALSHGVLENATPFVVPVFGSVTGATADHVEGTNPTDGTLTLTTKTVTPGAISGSLVLTREIVDSSNPAIDQIALNAMLESYNQQTEGKVYTLLNGANGAGGTITSGFVPSGAQAATFASTGGTPFAEAALIKGIRQQLAIYPFRRFASPSRGFMGQNATSIIAGTMDSTGRPIFPSVGAQNSVGTGNAVTQGWNVDGLVFVPAWAMTGVAAGDSQMLMLNELDGWAWESPLLTFRFEEKQGPAKIELDLFGYFATHVLRPRGLSGIRIT